MRIYKEVCKKPNINGDINQYFKECDENFELLKEINNECIKANELLGFVLKFPVADGFAYYQITNIAKDKVFVEVCKWLGDDYCNIVIGNSNWIRKAIADTQLDFEKFIRKQKRGE